MNSTNRALNRALLAVIGVILVALAAALAWLLVVPGAGSLWRTGATAVLAWTDEVFGRPLWSGTTVGPAAIVALAAAVLVVVLLLAFALRQGGGATATLVRARGDDGAIEIDTAVPARLLVDRLRAVPGVAHVTVSAYRVRRQPALKLTVDCRRGASPRTIVDAVDDAVLRLGEALGAEPPVFAQLTGGFRARVRTPVRVDTGATAVRSIP
ncbi:hypothetical protein [Leifsonia aquatica]|uniref:hypothetical protein n=1 Tax=Leifsonia aquatica TaxID=144185 RepID=UPI00046ABC03|nr:hypothetical protein [Leifsonia aquatica]